MKELSIFVDESGDFGEYNFKSPYYIISMVFHEQYSDISEDIHLLENELKNIGLEKHCIHTGSIIRAEEEYREYSLSDRKRIIMKMSER